MSDTKFNILLSFIIPAHNSERTLSNCVESIENDVHLSDISCELIIIEIADWKLLQAERLFLLILMMFG